MVQRLVFVIVDVVVNVDPLWRVGNRKLLRLNSLNLK